MMIGAQSDKATKPRRSGRGRTEVFLGMDWRNGVTTGAISFVRAMMFRVGEEMGFNFSMNGMN
jgi:hypothetical protein